MSKINMVDAFLELKASIDFNNKLLSEINHTLKESDHLRTLQLKEIHNRLKDISNDLHDINSREKDKERASYKMVNEDFIINADDTYTTFTVTNQGYTKARLNLNIQFTSAHTAGLTADLYHGNGRIGEVFDVSVSDTSVDQISEPFDISHLTQFHFQLKNNDTVSAVNIHLVRVIMYKE